MALLHSSRSGIVSCDALPLGYFERSDVSYRHVYGRILASDSVIQGMISRCWSCFLRAYTEVNTHVQGMLYAADSFLLNHR